MSRIRQRPILRLAREQMNALPGPRQAPLLRLLGWLLRHHHIPIHPHPEATPHLFETDREERVHLATDKLQLAMTATESDEVRLSPILPTLHTGGHEQKLRDLGRGML